MMQVMIPALRMTLDDTDDSFRASVARQLNLGPEDMGRLRVLRRAVDARKKGDVFFSVHVLADLSPRAARRVLGDRKLHAQAWQEPAEAPLVHGDRPPKGRIVVVGMGPGGLFAGWLLAKEGYRPLIVDRGKAMEDRVLDVESYWRTGRADPESNPLFGEGGAGTFSDGKLTARSKDPRCATVLDTFIAAGAPEEIGVLAKPHVGTDRLRQVVKNLREEIVALGGQVRFSTKLEAIHTKDGQLSAVTLVHEGVPQRVDCAALVLAIGQGARDTYRYLFDSGFAMAPKPFAVGVRAEHPQSLIDESQYGPFARHPKLGAADYKLTAQAGGRGVYSFCMCPGGFVVASGAGPREMVVNGMSNFDRAGPGGRGGPGPRLSAGGFPGRAEDPSLRVRIAHLPARGHGGGPEPVPAALREGRASGGLRHLRPADTGLRHARRGPHRRGVKDLRPGAHPAGREDAVPDPSGGLSRGGGGGLRRGHRVLRRGRTQGSGSHHFPI